ncbi:MAG TPA: hypothetical protein VHY20_09450 [Pirellulales bacterium]|jgi:hypothetical protein|nr:hypothetical protein [Pirellulales bacterium]
MAINQPTADVLEAMAKILLRCFLLGLLLLLVWTACLVLAPELFHRTYGKMFELAPHDLSVIHYCALALTKICILLFFGFPYLAIRMVLRNRMK